MVWWQTQQQVRIIKREDIECTNVVGEDGVDQIIETIVLHVPGRMSEPLFQCNLFGGLCWYRVVSTGRTPDGVNP